MSHALGSAKSVREWTLTLPSELPCWELVRIGVPKGLPKFQRAFWGVKTWLVSFFISMESSWSVGVENGLALPIWTSETQVMAKRRPESRTPESPPVLTPDHKRSGIDPKYLAAENVQHIVGKVSMRPTTLLETASRSEVCFESYEASKLRESRKCAISGLPRGSPGTKWPFGCHPRDESQSIL
jgi:hypothetical protein